MMEVLNSRDRFPGLCGKQVSPRLRYKSQIRAQLLPVSNYYNIIRDWQRNKESIRSWFAFRKTNKKCDSYSTVSRQKLEKSDCCFTFRTSKNERETTVSKQLILCQSLILMFFPRNKKNSKVIDPSLSANGEVECAPQIEAHKQCLRDLGFKV